MTHGAKNGARNYLWQGHVTAHYPDDAEHFPSQAEVLALVSEGRVFHGPFVGWDEV